MGCIASNTIEKVHMIKGFLQTTTMKIIPFELQLREVETFFILYEVLVY